MADKVLKEKRKQFIHSMGTGVINGVLDELLEKKVLNQEEMEKIKFENVTSMEKARNLIDSVARKGPKACQVFINIVCEEDSHLAEKLGLSIGPQTVQDSNEIFPSFAAPQALYSQQPEPTSSAPNGSLKLCPIEIAKKIWEEKSPEIYPIMGKLTRTRLALIICNMEFDNLPRRTGAEIDVRDMKMLLESLGYKVEVKENLTALDMASEVKAFAARPEHRTSDSTFLVFMSHGIREGICGKKFSEKVLDVLEVNLIFQMLNTSNCPSLKDKPKVIIIQACRGENQGVVWLKDSVRDFRQEDLQLTEGFEDDGIKKAHIEKDFIAFCSSTPDNVSWRHPTRGSLFIIKLIEIMKEYAWSCDLEDIFRKVRLSFEQPDNRAQMPTTERATLTRRFYLFPGH